MRSDNGLRNYQIQAKNDIYSAWDKCNNVMFQMPTGTGKTVLFASIINELDIFFRLRGGRPLKILIIAHRDELIDQISTHLGKRAIHHGIIKGGIKKDYSLSVQVGSINTVTNKSREKEIRRLAFDYIIIDEAHHSAADSYRKLWEYFPEAKKLGVTATPCRLDGKGFTDLYDELILSWSVKRFMEEKWLSPYQYFSVPPTSDERDALASIKKFTAGDYDATELERKFDTMKIRARLYQAYEKYVKGKKGIIYAIKVAHSQNICEDFMRHGVKAVSIDAKTPAKERKELVQKFKNGEIEVLVNVDIFSEGFDCPDIEFIQLARPTQSLTKYIQQVGRGLRPTASKSHCIILDNVGLYERFGFPDADRKWRHHFLGKEKEEVSVAEIQSEGGHEREQQDMSEGNENMELLQGAQFMELDDTPEIIDDFPCSDPDNCDLDVFLGSVGYNVQWHAFYFGDTKDVYDMNLTMDNQFIIFKLIFNFNTFKELWEEAKSEYAEREEDSYFKIFNSPDFYFHGKLVEYWNDETNYQGIATIKHKDPLFEKILRHEFTAEDLTEIINKAGNSHVFYENTWRNFTISKYSRFNTYIIEYRKGTSVTDCVAIDQDSELGYLISKDVQKARNCIPVFSKKEIWFMESNDEENTGTNIHKFNRVGRKTGESPSNVETEFQKSFWNKAAILWSNEKYKNQVIKIAPYLQENYIISSYSFDLTTGPGTIGSYAKLPLEKLKAFIKSRDEVSIRKHIMANEKPSRDLGIMRERFISIISEEIGPRDLWWLIDVILDANASNTRTFISEGLKERKLSLFSDGSSNYFDRIVRNLLACTVKPEQGLYILNIIARYMTASQVKMVNEHYKKLPQPEHYYYYFKVCSYTIDQQIDRLILDETPCSLFTLSQILIENKLKFIFRIGEIVNRIRGDQGLVTLATQYINHKIQNKKTFLPKNVIMSIDTNGYTAFHGYYISVMRDKYKIHN